MTSFLARKMEESDERTAARERWDLARTRWREAKFSSKLLSLPYRVLLAGGYPPSPALAVGVDEGQGQTEEDPLLADPESGQGPRRKPPKIKYRRKYTTECYEVVAGFHDPVKYKRFVTKVFGFIMIQHLIMAGCATLFFQEPRVKEFARENDWMGHASWILLLIMILLGVCMAKLIRLIPHVFLSLLSLFLTVLLSYTAAEFKTRIGIVAVACVAAISLTVIGIVLRGWRLSGCVSFLGSIPITVIACCFAVFICGVPFKAAVAGGCMAVLFSLYLVWDLRQIMGDRVRRVTAEEWGFACVGLHTDLINMAFILVQLLDMAAG
ncbi:hypothetical protein BSKO_12140 [Bryopsis sp. KO-2023]|nr:hypothetical protein BSKO_12140 [Bryopsis sp. KO-2023]